MIKPLSEHSVADSARRAASSHSPAPPPDPAPSREPSTNPAPGAERTSVADSAWIASAVNQFEVPLTQYATRLLSGDIDRARDVVQDTFLKLWTADRATVEGHMGQWLYRVCRNRALDVRRKESRMTALNDEQIEVTAGRSGAGAARSPHERDPDAAPNDTAHELPGAAVMSLLETLNDTQQEALRLKFQGGLSYKEIAAVMDITSNHVGVLIHHAIKALREHMAAHRHNQQHGLQPGQAQA